MERKDQRLVAALAGGLGVSLLAIAFLIGRVTARPANTAGVAGTPLVVATPASDAGLLAATTPIPSGTEPDPVATPLPSFGGESVPAPLSAATEAMPTDRAAIAAYFAQTDQLEDMGAGDPQAFANTMMQSITSGDFSSFDNLLAKARTQRDRLKALTPPPACASHHRLALTLAEASVSMLDRLKAALIKGDTTALLTMATEGHSLEEQANRLKTIGEAIKRQAGLP